MTCVVVQRYPFGSTSFSESVCDVFDRDTLTVSCADPDFDRKYGPLEVFKAGTWLSAVTFDAQGHPLQQFVSALGMQLDEARQTGLRAAS